MSRIEYNANVLNQRGTPAFFQSTIADRPTPGLTGRIFISTDTFVIQRDTGSSWQDIGGVFSGSGLDGEIAFFTGTSTVSGDNNFFWNNSNKRLGIGTASPSGRVDIHATNNNLILNATINVFPFAQVVQQIAFNGVNRFQWEIDNKNVWDNATNLPKLFLRNDSAGVTFIQTTNATNSTFQSFLLNDYDNLRLSGKNTTYSWGQAGDWYRFMIAPVVANPLFAVSFPSGNFGGAHNAGLVFDSAFPANPDFRIYARALAPTFSNGTLEFVVSTGGTQNSILSLVGSSQIARFSGRVNVNGAVDNALFELNVNGNTYTGGLSPTILTVTGNTNMARTVTGYYVTANATLTLPIASGLNNLYWIIAGSGVTVTVNRNGADDILNLSGTSVTSITINPNQRALFYVGGGTRTFLISQA